MLNLINDTCVKRRARAQRKRPRKRLNLAARFVFISSSFSSSSSLAFSQNQSEQFNSNVLIFFLLARALLFDLSWCECNSLFSANVAAAGKNCAGAVFAISSRANATRSAIERVADSQSSFCFPANQWRPLSRANFLTTKLRFESAQK